MKTINNFLFFLENNPKNGITNASNFLAYINRITARDVKNLKRLFKHLNSGVNINVSDMYTTKDDVNFFYVNARYKKSGGENFSIVAFPDFEKFKDALYHFEMNLDLDGLIEEANKLEIDIVEVINESQLNSKKEAKEVKA